jgi:lysophospholipase L1-like esterase
MFGGSTLWGTGARDAFTIPSVVATELHKRGLTSEVTNFGETGYVTTQETVMLLLLLQKGAFPDIVVFYDGVNDTFSAMQQGVPGLPQNEFNRALEFNLSQSDKSRQRIFMDLRDFAQGLSTTRLITWMLAQLGPSEEQDSASPALDRQSLRRLSGGVLDVYTGNMSLVKALGAHYGFQSVFYWQPTIFEKGTLTQYEEVERDRVRHFEPFFRATYDLVQQMARDEREKYNLSDLSTVFSDVHEPVYVDCCHVAEAGNQIIGKKIASDIGPLVAARIEMKAKTQRR